MDSKSPEGTAAGGGEGRRSRLFEAFLFLAVFGWVPFYAAWVNHEALRHDRITEAQIAKSPDHRLHDGTFVYPQGCPARSYAPGDVIDARCRTWANFLGYGWTWSGPWRWEDRVGDRPARRKLHNDGYYRMGDDVIEVRCDAGCSVSAVARSVFVPG